MLFLVVVTGIILTLYIKLNSIDRFVTVDSCRVRDDAARGIVQETQLNKAKNQNTSTNTRLVYFLLKVLEMLTLTDITG